MKKVYISGPMTGIEALNKPAFDQAEKLWQEKGWLAINPFNINDDQFRPYHDMMANDIDFLTKCQAIAVLPHWIESLGARTEVYWAVNICKIPVFNAINGEEIKVEISLSINI